MNRCVITDAGVLVAMLVRNDQHHAWTKEQASRISTPLLSCEPVLADAAHLLRRCGADETVLVEWVERGMLSLPFSLQTEAATVKWLMQNYRNVPMSLADAYLVRMAELYEGAAVFTLDSDFRIYRMAQVHAVPLIAPF